LVANSAEGVSRFLAYQEHVWIGFALYQGSPTAVSWELHHQVKTGGSPPTGWGAVNHPSVEFARIDNDSYHIKYRYNGPDGLLVANTAGDIPVALNQWQQFVIHYYLANYDDPANGIIEVWAATGNGPLVKYVDLHNITAGYVYSSSSWENSQALKFGVYGSSYDSSRHVYIDELRVSKDPNATAADLDPYTYQP